MSNTNAAVLADEVAREFNLFLGTYWFDFEQAAELDNATLASRTDARPGGQRKTTEGQLPDYII
jgi:hypothetical protein